MNGINQNCNSVNNHSSADKLEIKVEGRIFSLKLDNLNDLCIKELETIFDNKECSLEELLTVCISLIREKSIFQIKANELIKNYIDHINL